MSKNKFYPDEDINDIIESEDQAFFKGRGPDKKPRKKRGEGQEETFEQKRDRLNAEIAANYKKMGRRPDGSGPTGF